MLADERVLADERGRSGDSRLSTIVGGINGSSIAEFCLLVDCALRRIGALFSGGGGTKASSSTIGFDNCDLCRGAASASLRVRDPLPVVFLVSVDEEDVDSFDRCFESETTRRYMDCLARKPCNRLVMIARTVGRYISKFSGVASSAKHCSSTALSSSGTDKSSLHITFRNNQLVFENKYPMSMLYAANAATAALKSFPKRTYTSLT